MKKLIIFTLILCLIWSTPVQAASCHIVKEEDINLLACVIHGESGADYCSDTMRYYVGSVVINRVNCGQFPNTIKEVIYQEGQYGCVDGKYFKANEECLQIARDLLINGSCLPSDVVYQSNTKLGHGVYVKEQNMYFCYI